MTDDITYPSGSIENEIDSFICQFMGYTKPQMFLTSNQEELERCSQLIHPELLSQEDIQSIDLGFSEIFTDSKSIGDNTAIDVYLCEERSFGKLLTQRLNLEIFHHGYRVCFNIVAYSAWGKYQVSKVRIQYPMRDPYDVGDLSSLKYANLLLKGMKIVGNFVEKAYL